uniref:Uncharacterized protein n=1 Tax=Manihot esculenta TaxID=3983 RepID=A0A199UB11_MANES
MVVVPLIAVLGLNERESNTDKRRLWKIKRGKKSRRGRK